MKLNDHQLDDLEFLAKEIAQKSRIKALQMVSAAKTSHIGACLSVIDILASLFALKQHREQSFKDNVILSKGHAAAALYAVLETAEVLNGETKDFCRDGSQLYGHINHHASVEIPLSTGSLGHGLPFGLGMAMAAKMKKEIVSTYVIVSDGELNEGTTWESALIAAHHQLQHLVVVIDRNRIQSLGYTEEILKLDPIAQKWEAFGWIVIEIDGHDVGAILNALTFNHDKPLCVIANTVKGKGVSFMENRLEWHYRSPSPQELEEAIDQINGGAL